MVVGISGARHNAAVSLCIDGQPVAVCEQERVSRTRHVGLTPGLLPAEALEAVLRHAGGRGLPEVEHFALGDPDVVLPATLRSQAVDHHRAHAVAAFRLSGFDRAAVLVADHRPSDPTTVWVASPDGIRAVPWPHAVPAFARLYADCAKLFGLEASRAHELEALARLSASADAGRLAPLLGDGHGALTVQPAWREAVEAWLREDETSLLHRAQVAHAFQERLGTLLIEFAREMRRHTAESALCLGGGLFYNTYFTTLLRRSGVFDRVFTPPNPGTASTAIGAALDTSRPPARPGTKVSPFLGPEYSPEEIKTTLDNCKLSYECVTEADVIAIAADALAKGQLVGWFHGRMEWGHRALGHRSILASPTSPYVLDNLNLYLKQRPRYRTYGVSVPLARADRWFDNPVPSPFMEHEFHPADPETFRHVLPRGIERMRVQTIEPDPDDVATSRFERLHHAVAEVTGLPVLVNTSFNGFREPMVCSPRDAVRVFYGTGLDLLVLDRFIVRK